jgi:hypothetical protein
VTEANRPASVTCTLVTLTGQNGPLERRQVVPCGKHGERVHPLREQARGLLWSEQRFIARLPVAMVQSITTVRRPPCGSRLAEVPELNAVGEKAPGADVQQSPANVELLQVLEGSPGQRRPFFFSSMSRLAQ